MTRCCWCNEEGARPTKYWVWDSEEYQYDWVCPKCFEEIVGDDGEQLEKFPDGVVR